MFTGIVRERGHILRDPEPSGQGGVRLVIGHSEGLAERLTIGASLAVSGVCLTITRQVPGEATVELSPETLSRTALGTLAAGDEVNLEPALCAGEPLGGHWVQGHVDTTVEVVERHDLGDHRELWFSLPPDMQAYLVEKGSVSLDGVSLTIARRLADRFSVALIPHTLEVTTLGLRRVGDRLHLEVDILAKYIEQVLVARGLVAAPPTPPAPAAAAGP